MNVLYDMNVLEFSEFCDVTYRKIVHHNIVIVRWLSLQAATDSLTAIQCFM